MTRAGSAQRVLLRRAGQVSRALHARGILRGKASGGVRFVAGKVAVRGTYPYRDQYGHAVEASLDDYMERIGFFGAHSSALLRRIPSWLRPGDWAIDAGANVGLVSSAMAAAVGARGSVWAVEPLPRNVQRLLRLKDQNALEQLTVLPVALSSKDSTAKLRISSQPGGSGSGAASMVAPWNREGHVDVSTRRLDDLVAEQAPDAPLRLVKIDVEGFEMELLAGAKDTFTTRRPLVVCEFHDPLLRAAGVSSEELLGVFSEYGYVPGAPYARPRGTLDGRVVDMLLVPREGRSGPKARRRVAF